MEKDRGEEVYTKVIEYCPYEDPRWQGKITTCFSYQSSGWALLWISTTAAFQNISIHLSYAFDPYGDLVRWLEAICSDQPTNQFSINEEGTFITLRFTRLGPDLLDFQVHEGDGDIEYEDQDILLRCRVSAKQLVQEFVSKLDLFLRNYSDRKEWILGFGINISDLARFNSYLNPGG